MELTLWHMLEDARPDQNLLPYSDFGQLHTDGSPTLSQHTASHSPFAEHARPQYRTEAAGPHIPTNPPNPPDPYMDPRSHLPSIQTPADPTHFQAPANLTPPSASADIISTQIPADHMDPQAAADFINQFHQCLDSHSDAY